MDLKDLKILEKIKDVFLAKKQGEALERISTPLTHNEALSLGNYAHQAAYAVAVVDLHETLINDLVNIEEDEKGELSDDELEQCLHVFTETVARSSGSISAKRMEKGYETIAQLGQYFPGIPKRQPLQPEKVDLNE